MYLPRHGPVCIVGADSLVRAPDDTPVNPRVKGHFNLRRYVRVPWWTLPGYIGWSRRRRGPGRMAPLHGSLQQPEGPPDSPVSSALSGHR